ncbi:hypothetical protein VSS74_17895 [Conexibacter stalactiti]|uniref:Uncharacterized protein n=1 Tax=Conexibacter stalactiti TaxID=1940611 RepID=A0ABU4HSD9_9ACTN|nr:hypothetical protein [Conexibacter stalactiti]MDW5596226.1 hypothetical protein [Conexibacter stalactiti]MEC5036868.1 hypothetical protein [Conexibacter stalactiti]
MRTLVFSALLAVAAVVASPAAASAAATVTAFELTAPGRDPRLGELELRASCRPGCTLKLRELNVLRYKTRGGTPQQLPHAAAGPLKGTYKLAAGKPQEIRIVVPVDVQAVARESLPAGLALVGNVTMSVTAADGTTTDAVRQFNVRTAKTPAPFPRSSVVDSIVVTESPRAVRGKRWNYAVTIEGRQTSRWSYDRNRTTGGCTVVDNGRGVQRLTFRSKDGYYVQHVPTASGWPMLLVPGRSFEPMIPIRIEAERDSSENKGTSGDCGGGTAGGAGGSERRRCIRTGGRPAFFDLGYVFHGDNRYGLYAGATYASFERPTVEPDCPFEMYADALDPLQPEVARANAEAHRTLAAGPGQAVMLFNVNRREKIEGGWLSSSTRYSVTFRKSR